MLSKILREMSYTNKSKLPEILEKIMALSQKNKYKPVSRPSVTQKCLSETFHCKVCHTSQFIWVKYTICAYNSLPLASIRAKGVPQSSCVGLPMILETMQVLSSVSFWPILLNSNKLSEYSSIVIHIY